MLTLKEVLPLINTYMKVSFYFTKKQKHMPSSDELFEKYKDTKLEKDSLVFDQIPSVLKMTTTVVPKN